MVLDIFPYIDKVNDFLEENNKNLHFMNSFCKLLSVLKVLFKVNNPHIPHIICYNNNLIAIILNIYIFI